MAFPTNSRWGIRPFTNRELAAANGWTVDAAEKWLRRRFERGEFTRKYIADPDPETKRKYWTFVYELNANYVSPAAYVQQIRDVQRAVCKVISDAVDAEREAENQAIRPYLEPARHDEWFTQYCQRHDRALAMYFENHPGARAAHDAREAAGKVVYELMNGRRPSERDVSLAQDFSWGKTRLTEVEMRFLHDQTTDHPRPDFRGDEFESS